MRKALEEAQQQAKKDHTTRNITNNDVVACCKFHFWELMLSTRFINRIWEKSWKTCFPYANHQSCDELILELKLLTEKIRRFRNRVAHHEPIYSSNVKRYLDEIRIPISYVSMDLVARLNNSQKVDKAIDNLDHFLSDLKNK